MVDTGTKGQKGYSASSTMYPAVHLTIGMGMAVSARFAWLYSHAETDTPPPALALFLFELPLLFCLLPFITSENSKRRARSAGMLFGTALGFCPLPLPLEFDAQLTARGGGGYPGELARFLPICFVTALCMLGISWWCGRDDRPEFIAGTKRGVLSFLLVSLLVLIASIWGRV